MILKALYDYYERRKDLAPDGFEMKEIPFIIRIGKDGKFQGLEDMRFEKKKCKSFLVVKSNGRTSAPMANVLWDNVEYVLNYTENHIPPQKELTPKEENKRLAAIEKSAVKNQLFIDKVNELSARYPDNIAFKAVANFYAISQFELIKQDRLWCEIEKKPTVNLSFRLEDSSELIAQNEDLLDYVNASQGNKESSEKDFPVCLITGERAEPVLTSTATMIPGSQATAKLVSFQVNSGYDSYGNSKGLNAPISKKAESAYTTALNNLLRKDSPNKFLIGDRTFLFWASSLSEGAMTMEECVGSLFGYIKSEKEDDPNRRIEEVRKTFKSISSGYLHTNLDDRFYFLGLAPNSARIAVVYWQECCLKEFAESILKHFDDMEIVDTRREQTPYYGLHQILRGIALQGKSENIPPNLPEAVMKSILQGVPYPDTLFQACIRRIRATREIGITRAAILKGYINRKLETINYNNEKSITMAVDKENTNPGYLCGRLFATLVYLQETVNNQIDTIREKYMSAASSTPATVFPTLLNLSIHHAEKLEKGLQNFFEREKAEIIDKISSEGFPSHLNLQEQGCFMVGYYHQRQYYYTPKEERDKQQN